MRKSYALSLSFALSFLLIANAAYAAGPVVGKDCTASWTAPTTNTDGTPIAFPLTYNTYVATGTPTTPPATPTTTGIAATTTQPCKTLAAGQYTLWVTAVEQFTGSASESDKTAPFPFVLGAPTVPGGVVVK